MSDVVRAETRGGVCSISLNHPESGNALSDAAISRLGDVLESVDSTVRIITLQGVGTDFCAGRAPPAPGGARKALEAIELRRAHDIVFRVYGLIRSAPAPVIAVVRGRALGFGFALAAIADITVSAEDATFQVPEFAHNIMPTMVMSAMIDRVPLKAAMYHVYSTEPFDAAEALRIGAISAIKPGDELDDDVSRLVDRLLAAPAPALLSVKDFARNAQAIDINKTVQYARALHAVVNSSSEMHKK
jgi:enoyl-CoA hydratase